MSTAIHEPCVTFVIAPSGMTELVRGNDQRLIDRVSPLVHERDVTLDCRTIERIDAAGIAALISLYGSAHDAGHAFTLRNVRSRVAEILALVGLAPILVSHNVVQNSHSDACMERPAA